MHLYCHKSTYFCNITLLHLYKKKKNCNFENYTVHKNADKHLENVKYRFE